MNTSCMVLAPSELSSAAVRRGCFLRVNLVEPIQPDIEDSEGRPLDVPGKGHHRP